MEGGLSSVNLVSVRRTREKKIIRLICQSYKFFFLDDDA